MREICCNLRNIANTIVLFTFFQAAASFKIRLYHRDVYLGLPETETIFPSMVNYEVAQKFETDQYPLDYSLSYIVVKETVEYTLSIVHDRNMLLVYWGKHGGGNQRFHILHAPLNAKKILMEKKCLEYDPTEDELRMEVCNESENQLFLFVEDEDEDHGLATQANVTVRHDLNGNFVYGTVEPTDTHGKGAHSSNQAYSHHGLGHIKNI